MKMRPLLLLAAALPLFAPGEASATSYCTAGALNACASVVVEKNGDVVVIRVTNLQGYDPADNTWYSGLWGIDLFAPGITGASAVSTSFGGAGYAESAAPAWTVYAPTSGWLRLWGPSTGGNIAGCTPGPASLGPLAGLYQTCGSGSWIEFTFSTYGNWDVNDAYIAWGAHAMSSQSSELRSLYCDSRTGASCGTFNTVGTVATVNAPTPPGNVTPEPVTLALLGTGLAGVGAAARRRRKQQSGDGA